MILRSHTPKKSTTMYNVMRGLYGESDKTVIEQIEDFRKVLFNYNYNFSDLPINDSIKEVLEKSFISHYINYYFSEETFEIFHLKVYSKMLEIIPKYTPILIELYNSNKTIFDDVTVYEKESIGDSTNQSTSNSTTNNNTHNENDSTTTQNNKSLNANLPIGIINFDEINSIDYADNGGLQNNKTVNNNVATNTTNTFNNSESNDINNNHYNENSKTTHSTNTIEKIKSLSEMSSVITDFLSEFDVLFSQVIN